jgi:uncharacterized Zn-binding protein involved in type VI secretion
MCLHGQDFVMLEGLDMFRQGAVASHGKMIPSGNKSFMKGT